MDFLIGSNILFSETNFSMITNNRKLYPLAIFSLIAVFATSAFAENPQDFSIESPTHGTKFTLSEQKGKVIAIHFLLKTECPFCSKYTHDYAKLEANTPDVVHLFVKPDSVDEIKAWAGKIDKKDLKALPIIYRDPDARLAKEFGVPDGYKFHGQSVHFPALVVLNSSGSELFRYVGKNNSDRMKPDDFIAKLKAKTENSSK